MITNDETARRRNETYAAAKATDPKTDTDCSVINGEGVAIPIFGRPKRELGYGHGN
jgi:hypothetical protein